MSACVKAVVAVLALGLTAARADPISDARRLSANPDTSAMSFFWRNKTHATLGAEIPLLLPEDTGGWSLRLSASVQLDNDLPNFLPNNYWRGLVGAELGHRFSLGPGLLANIAFLIQLDGLGPPDAAVDPRRVAIPSNFISVGCRGAIQKPDVIILFLNI